jgi:hypothetical protein
MNYIFDIIEKLPVYKYEDFNKINFKLLGNVM